MARSVDQAPHNPYDNSDHNPRPGVHPERVPTSLGGSTPVYEDWQPYRGDRQPRNKNKLTALVALGGVAATGIAGAAVYLGMRSATTEQIEKVTAATSTSAEPFPEAQNIDEYKDPIIVKYDLNQNGLLDREERDAMAPEDYVTLDSEVRAADRAERFNMHLYSAYENIQPYLTSEESKILYMPDLSKPRAEWTDQDYLNYYSLSIWLSTAQPDTDEALRAISVVAQVGTNAHTFLRNWVENNPGQGLKAIYETVSTPLSNTELVSTSVGPITIDENGGRLDGHQSLASGEENYTVFKNYTDPSGNVITTSEHVYDSLSDKDIQRTIHNHQ